MVLTLPHCYNTANQKAKGRTEYDTVFIFKKREGTLQHDARSARGKNWCITHDNPELGEENAAGYSPLACDP